MKKKFVAFISLLSAVSMLVCSCASRTGSDGTTTTSAQTTDSQVTTTQGSPITNEPQHEGSLEDIMNAMYASASDHEFPSVVGHEVDISDTDTFRYYFGTDSTGVKEAYVSEPMIGSMAYTLGLVRAESDSRAAELADEIKSGVDPMKWVCVTATVVEVRVKGDVVLLVMDTNTDRANAIIAAFEG